MPIRFTFSESDISFNTKVKVYPDGATSVTYCSKQVFRQPGFEKREQKDPFDDCIAKVGIGSDELYKLALQSDSKNLACDELKRSREEELNENVEKCRDRSTELVRLHRDRVRDIVLMNDFKYFLTITINPEKIDSFDVEKVKKKLMRWLKNCVDRKGLKYVLIPEYHKSQRIHAHALVNDVFKLVDSGKRTSSGKIIYNVPEWRHGFTTCIELDNNKLRVANYVCKYITKGSDKIFGKYFWSSKNILRQPDIKLCDTDFDAVNAKVYQPLLNDDKLLFKYESSLVYVRDNSFESSCDECSQLATEGFL